MRQDSSSIWNDDFVGLALFTLSRPEKQTLSPLNPQLFEKLAELPVPPPPPTLNRAVHERINGRLLTGQLLDLATSGFGFAVLHLGRAFGELIRLTVTGKFEPRSRDGSGPAP